MLVPSEGPDSRATAIQANGITQAAAITISLRARDIVQPWWRGSRPGGR